MFLDTKPNFQEHLNNVLSKVNKTIRLLRKRQAFLLRQSLVTVYKGFIRTNLDYEDIIYSQTYDESFLQKMESIQYKAALAIAGAIRGTSKEKLYLEIGLESLCKTQWYRKLCYFFKTFKGQSPKYLFRILPSIKIPLFICKHNFFTDSYFPSTVVEWNNLDLKIRNSKTFSAFKKSILQFIWPSLNSIFSCHSPKGIKLITRLRLDLSLLREHKLGHNFYYCHYYFSLVFLKLVLYFTKWLYNDLLNFSFYKYISSHPTSICSKLVLLPGALLFTLSISLSKFLLAEIPVTKHLTYMVIVELTFKTCICACYIYTG